MAFDIQGYHEKYKDFYGDIPLDEVAKDAFARGGYDKEYPDYDTWKKATGIENDIQTDLKKRTPKTWEDKLSEGVASVTPGFKDISTSFVKGATLEYVPSVETPADAGILRKGAVGAAHLAGMSVPIGIAAMALPAAATIGGVMLTSGALGGLYGLLRKPEEGESRWSNAAKDAAMFATFGVGGKVIGSGLKKLFPETVGKVFEKIAAKQELTPAEKTIYSASQYGSSATLGMGAGATESADTWEQRLQNIAVGGITFAGAHGISSNLMKLVREGKATPDQLEYIKKLEAAANTSKIIDEGLKTGKIGEEVFTPNHALELIKTANDSGVYSTEDVAKLKDKYENKYPDLKQGLNNILKDSIKNEISFGIDVGLKNGNVRGVDFTPDHALEVIKDGRAKGIFTDADIDSFRDKYPILKQGLNDIVVDSAINKVNEALKITRPVMEEGQKLNKIIPKRNIETDVPLKLGEPTGETKPAKVSPEIANLQTNIAKREKYLAGNKTFEGTDMYKKNVAVLEKDKAKLAELTREVTKPTENIAPTTEKKPTAMVDYAAEAKKAGAEFIGMQESKTAPPQPTFTDPETKTTFMLNEGESVSEALSRKRQQFAAAKQPTIEPVVENKESIEKFAKDPDIVLKSTETEDGLKQYLENKEGKQIPVDDVQAEHFINTREKEATRSKESWEMTKKEYIASDPNFPNKKDLSPSLKNDRLGIIHNEIVANALDKGKPVPPEVLKDYPELTKGISVKEKKSKKISIPENVVTRIMQEGGINFGIDYQKKYLKEYPDLKRVFKTTGKEPDAMANILKEEGYDIKNGDDLIEKLKTSEARNVLNPEKQESILNRKLKRLENEYIERELANLEEKIDAGTVTESHPDIQRGVLEALRVERDISSAQEEVVLAELSSFFSSLTELPKTNKSWVSDMEAKGQAMVDAGLFKKETPKGDFKNAEISDASARETFNLVNPETEISPKLSEQVKPKNAEMFAEKAQKETLPTSGNIQDFGEKIGGARKDLAERGYEMGKNPKTEEGEQGWRKKYVAMAKVDGSGWTIGKKGDTFGISARTGQKFATQEEAEKAIPLFAVAEKHFAYPNNDGTYSIYKKTGERKRLRVVNQNFPSREEAMKYMAGHAEELLNLKTSFGEEILPTPEKVYRSGIERRTGPATPEMFTETFKPRGIEFGNWNNQAERQEVMNHAYDGLLDLADALKIPPKALMLNGDLAIAFGARGQGLVGAKAHYERDYGVINLTKMKGAGALAHEWLHAFDHYLGRLDTKASSEKIKNKKGDLVYPEAGPDKTYLSSGAKVLSKLRPEVKEAYKNLIEGMYKKAEQYVEDTKQADKFVGTTREELKKRLDMIRVNLEKDLVKEYTWRKNKRGLSPASAEQLADYDRLVNILVEGGDLETKFKHSEKARWGGYQTNDTLEAISKILKDVRGRAGFNSEHTGVLDYVRSDMNLYNTRLKMFTDAKAGTEKTKKVPTSYAIEARKMDQARAGDYWSEPHEMAARAFSSFVEDKIAESGGQSDFLVYHAHGGIFLPMIDGYIARPYPEGKERVAINETFQKFIDTLKVKEEGEKVTLYSGKNQPGNVTIDTIKNHPRFKSATVTENEDGSAQVLFRNGDGFKVDFITDMADKGVKLETSYGNFKKDTSKKVAGAYVEENKTILFNKDRAGIPTVDHEVMHFMSKSGYLDSRDTRILNMGAKRSGFEMTEEGRADFVAQAFQKRDEQVGIVKQVLQKIGDFFDMVMNAVGHRTTGGVLRDIESGKIMEAKGIKGEGGLTYSLEKGNKQTETPTFKKWFADSKVVDNKGKPLVVYHGTPNGIINQFKKPGHDGIYLTSDKSYAKYFTDKGVDKETRKAHIVEAYVKAKNPKYYDFYNEDEFNQFTQRGVDIQALMDEGYDSAILRAKSDEPIDVMVFSPTQIKSATGNNGNFDPNNPNINYSLQDVGKSIDAMKEKLNKFTDKTDAVKNAKDGFGLAYDGAKRAFYPSARTEAANKAAETIIGQMGKNFHQQALLKGKLNEVVSNYRESTSVAAKTLDLMQTSTGILADGIFNKMPKEEQWDFIYRIQKGQKQENQELQGIADTLSKMYDDLYRDSESVTPGAVKYRKGYFPGMWEDATAAERFFSDRLKSMEGSKAFIKEKIFDDIQAGIEAGLKPKGTPIDMAFAKMHEVQKYVTTHRVLQEMEADKTAILIKSGEREPAGYKFVPEPYGVVTRKEKINLAGKQQDLSKELPGTPKMESYRYAVKDDVAQVFQNYLSRSLYENKYVGKVYEGYMNAANTLNQFQLGVGSAFHAGFTTMEAVISKFALGVKAMARGDVPEALKLMAASPLQVYKNPALGDKLLRAYRGESVTGQEIPQLVKWLEMAGGRATMDSRFRTSSTDKMIEAWTKGNKVSAVVRSPFAMVEQMARPILEWLVPRQKFGVFAEMATEWHKQNPNATHEETRSAMQYVWNRVDSRLGQVVYERLFTQNVAKNIVQGLVRAPGWSGGTIIEIGGGVNDFAKVFNDIAHGRKPQMTDKMAYTISLLTITGLINGVMTKLLTGENPKDGMDLLAFRTGKKDEHGNPERFLLPTYAKDIYAYINKPGTTLLNKSHPMLSLMADIAKNKDYYGVAVRDKEANLAVQAGQTGLYAAKAFVPFWMRGAGKAKERGDDLASMLSPLIGVMPATAEFTKTKAQKLISEILQERPKGTMTREKFETNQLKNKLETRLRNHDPEAPGDIQQYLKDGKLSRKDVMTIQKAVRTPYLVNAFKPLSLKEAIRVYSIATPEEKKIFLPLLRKKSHLLRDLPEEERRDTLINLRQVIKG